MKKQDAQQLIAELRRQYEITQEKAAFLSLKQEELRPGDEISFHGYLAAREQLKIEASLLAGHGQMLNELAAQKQITLDIESRRLFKQISVFSANVLTSFAPGQS